MSWSKLDDRFWAHPKVVTAGNEASGIFARCLSYCGANLTDGRVPASIALFIAGSKQTLEQVVATGLLDVLPHSGDYVISDYQHYNPSRDEVETKREARSEAGKRGGIASGKGRSK